jgi:hypothetical protein
LSTCGEVATLSDEGVDSVKAEAELKGSASIDAPTKIEVTDFATDRIGHSHSHLPPGNLRVSKST